MATTDGASSPSIEERLSTVERALALLVEQAGAADAASPQPNRSLDNPHTVPEAQRTAAWRDLAGWLEWLVTTYELNDQWPTCWYRHAGLVEEAVALCKWHRFATGHPSAAPADATLWHDGCWRFRQRALGDVRTRCRSGHREEGVIVLSDVDFNDFLTEAT